MKLYGPAVDWYSFGTMAYEINAHAHNSPVPVSLAPCFVLSLRTDICTGTLPRGHKCSQEGLSSGPAARIQEAIQASHEGQEHPQHAARAPPLCKSLLSSALPPHLSYRLPQLWAHPSSRGNYQTCYSSEFFHDIEARGPIFDILPELSAREPRQSTPLTYCEPQGPVPENLDVEHVYADADMGEEKVTVSWIRPNTEMFDPYAEPSK